MEMRHSLKMPEERPTLELVEAKVRGWRLGVCRVVRSILARGTETSPCIGVSPIPDPYDIFSSATCNHRDGNSCGGWSAQIIWGAHEEPLTVGHSACLTG